MSSLVCSRQGGCSRHGHVWQAARWRFKVRGIGSLPSSRWPIIQQCTSRRCPSLPSSRLLARAHRKLPRRSSRCLWSCTGARRGAARAGGWCATTTRSSSSSASCACSRCSMRASRSSSAEVARERLSAVTGSAITRIGQSSTATRRASSTMPVARRTCSATRPCVAWCTASGTNYASMLPMGTQQWCVRSGSGGATPAAAGRVRGQQRQPADTRVRELQRPACHLPSALPAAPALLGSPRRVRCTVRVPLRVWLAAMLSARRFQSEAAGRGAGPEALAKPLEKGEGGGNARGAARGLELLAAL